jgi:dTMP kinase
VTGRLIAFEGPDGAGKSTLLRALASALSERGFDVVCSREPTYGHYGSALRQAAQTERLPAEEELRLLLLDRREHVETLIAPALARGAWVLLDRYYFSTVAYQGAAGLDLTYLQAVNEEFAPVPDLLVLLDLPLDESLRRIRARGLVSDAFEAPDTLKRVREIFLSFAQLPFTHLLDATMPTAKLLDKLLTEFHQRGFLYQHAD